MVIFHSYVQLPEGSPEQIPNFAIEASKRRGQRGDRERDILTLLAAQDVAGLELLKLRWIRCGADLWGAVG